ncbi:chromosome partitioning protein ParA [uncultured Cellulomonas sp.]|uniref:MinD/ParA family ATP-binding protein n=1 Tax=uncultured Cellulomonas sp. TaxID=189682 RepID=UPI0026204D39|nr:chromosome partitioning protein ParA [uncultured Cellulomonas sp.]
MTDSYSATIFADGTAHLVSPDGVHELDGTGVEGARQIVVERLIRAARAAGEPLLAITTDPDGRYDLRVHPSGEIDVLEPDAADPAPQAVSVPVPAAAPAASVVPAPSSDAPQPPAAVAVVEAPRPQRDDPRTSSAPAPVRTEPTPAEPVAAAPAPAPPARSEAAVVRTAPVETPAPRRSLRETSFLVAEPAPQVATRGLRGLLAKAGLRVEPSPAEQAERADINTVSQHWPGKRTVAVVNRKGGANKTPTVACLAAVFARYGGAGVVAWDNNESQGTLGWRTVQGPHSSTVLDVLRDSDVLLSPSAESARLAAYLHHQPEDRYDVLRSDEDDQGDHEIAGNEVDVAHSVLARYYRLIIMDSGNTSRAQNWRRMIDLTQQLVVPATTMEDRAEAARLTLETLSRRDEHSARLAERAVVVISQWKADDRSEAERLADGFRPFVREVVTVPFDPALKAGVIRYDALQAATQRAWLAAAAAVARGL